MLRKLFATFVVGCAVGAAGFFGATQVIGGDTATQAPVVSATATPHVLATYQGGPLGTVVAPVQQPVSPPAKLIVPTPRPRVFPTPVLHPRIPYQGNGGGPTLCNDGSISGSSGPGTCSHHGGVAY
jgi:hypothetical protein